MTEASNERVALITGAASGIGRGTALAMARSGVSLCLVDLDERGLEQTASLVRESGGRTVTVSGDVSVEQVAEAARSAAFEAFDHVDILVNAAGIRGAGKPLRELSLSEWRHRFDVNATSCFLTCRAVVPSMIERGWGRIVNVSSQLALRGSAERADYCASKAAIHGLTFALAREVAAFGVTVNAVAPGPINTPMLASYPQDAISDITSTVPMGRLGEVEEVVPVVLMLTGESAGFITGTVVNVSGGDVISA